MLYYIDTRSLKNLTQEPGKSIISDLENKKDYISKLQVQMNAFYTDSFSLLCDKIAEIKNLKDVIVESRFYLMSQSQVSIYLDTLIGSLPKDLESLELAINDFPDLTKNLESFISTVPLETLSIHGTRIGSRGLQRISDCLDRVENKNNLKFLDLHSNRIDSICKSFAGIVLKYPNLQDIDLNENYIEDYSFDNLVDSLKETAINVTNSSWQDTVDRG